MSNKIVPPVYKQIISNTMTTSRTDFEEQGVEDAVMVQLQRLWEQKLAATGVADFVDDPKVAAEARAKHAAKTQAATGKKEEDAKKESSKPKLDSDELGSDLDDSDEDVDKEGGDLVIALYEKVSRVRTKWKVQLKDGVVNVKGREYLFNKMQGEFDW